MQRTPFVLHDKDEEYYKYLKNNDLIIFESVVGSQAYGTNIATSDEDRKFIFIEPLEKVLMGTHIDQLNVNKDYVGYELGRFLELLESSNPNINELLFAPEHTIKFIHPLFSEFILSNRQKFLTKSVYHSFGGYSISQIKKARGTNKKIVNPVDKERKGLLDFCWIGNGQGSKSLKEYLKENNLHPKECGCVAIDHMKNCYHLFVDETDNSIYKGITDVDDVQILLSSVKKGLKPELMFYCNLEGFQSYCKDYREYWEWEEKRNEDRYQQNIENGAEYDSKNMMHCIRLLETCIEILEDHKLSVQRPNREYLLDIRFGKFKYDEIMLKVDLLTKKLDEAFKNSTLPEKIDKELIHGILLFFRKKFYNLK